MSERKALVLGAGGFLGSTIAEQLVHEGSEVTVLDVRPLDAQWAESANCMQGSVLDVDLLTAAMRGMDEVYHFAGLLGTCELQATCQQAIETNVIGSVNVFEVAVRSGIPRVFYASKPNVWRNAYTITKTATEQFAELFSGGGTHIRSLRYFNVFGPRQSLTPIRKMIPTFAICAMRGHPIQIFGDGLQTVDLVYSEDVASLTLRFLRSGYHGSVLDCGSGRPMTVNDVAHYVNSYFGGKCSVRHLPMRPGESPGTILVADPLNLEGAIGPYSLTDFSVAMQRTLDWYASLSPKTIDAAVRYFDCDGHRAASGPMPQRR